MSIRAVGLSQNYSFQNQNRKAVSFSGETVDKTKVKEKNTITRAQAGEVSNIVGWGIAVMAVITLGTVGRHSNRVNMRENMEKFQEYIQSNDLQQDRFEVKDVTGDEIPDMILFKEDGSKVVFDVVEGKFKEEVTTLKEME